MALRASLEEEVIRAGLEILVALGIPVGTAHQVLRWAHEDHLGRVGVMVALAHLGPLVLGDSLVSLETPVTRVILGPVDFLVIQAPPEPMALKETEGTLWVLPVHLATEDRLVITDNVLQQVNQVMMVTQECLVPQGAGAILVPKDTRALQGPQVLPGLQGLVEKQGLKGQWASLDIQGPMETQDTLESEALLDPLGYTV